MKSPSRKGWMNSSYLLIFSILYEFDCTLQFYINIYIVTSLYSYFTRKEYTLTICMRTWIQVLFFNTLSLRLHLPLSGNVFHWSTTCRLLNSCKQSHEMLFQSWSELTTGKPKSINFLFLLLVRGNYYRNFFKRSRR